MTTPIALWSEGVPLARGGEKRDVPAITPYLPEPERASGAAIVVCPGGGYVNLAPHEAEPVARWLSGIGIAAFVLRYRLAPRYRHPAPLLDAARAVRTVRARAGEWGLDPARVGILGFSAGGHLASSLGTHFDAGEPNAADPIGRFSSRPDLMVLVYPAISFTLRCASRANLLGPDADPALVELMSSEAQVTPETPPAFLVHGIGDETVDWEHSVVFAQALRAAGVPFEMHLFEQGPHGFGLGGDDPSLSTWPDLCARWLARRGFGGRGGNVQLAVSS